jgi:nucleotide-binding universal stress UspA family protein
MRVLVWIAEGTWKAAVAAAKEFVPADADITLLHVVPIEPQAVVRDARHALLGRRHARSAEELQSMAAQVASGLLADAQTLLGRKAALDARRGRVGHEVVAAAQKMDLLVLARDRDRTDGGPPSLGPTARFVIDHSRCPLLLVFADPNKTDAT